MFTREGLFADKSLRTHFSSSALSIRSKIITRSGLSIYAPIEGGRSGPKASPAQSHRRRFPVIHRQPLSCTTSSKRPTSYIFPSRWAITPSSLRSPFIPPFRHCGAPSAVFVLLNRRVSLCIVLIRLSGLSAPCIELERFFRSSFTTSSVLKY